MVLVRQQLPMSAPGPYSFSLPGSSSRSSLPPAPAFVPDEAGGGDDNLYHHRDAPQRKNKRKAVMIEPAQGGGLDGGAAGPSKPRVKKKPDPQAKNITAPCTECGRRFWSWKALFGHMRCHPNRGYRGINRPRSVAGSGKKPLIIDDAEFNATERAVAGYLIDMANGSPKVAEQHAFCCCRDGADGVAAGIATTSSFPPSDCKFECNGCKTVFGSRQALGGHRATHKNVKGCFAIQRNGDSFEGTHKNGDDTCLALGGGAGGSSGGGAERIVAVLADVMASGGLRDDLDLNLPPPSENCNSSEVVLDLKLGV